MIIVPIITIMIVITMTLHISSLETRCDLDHLELVHIDCPGFPNLALLPPIDASSKHPMQFRQVE
jgi:hypothetical protein